MTLPRIDILHDAGGDWVAVYKDGVKVEENHTCDIRRGLEALKIPFTEREVVSDKYGLALDGSDPYPERLP